MPRLEPLVNSGEIGRIEPHRGYPPISLQSLKFFLVCVKKFQTREERALPGGREDEMMIWEGRIQAWGLWLPPPQPQRPLLLEVWEPGCRLFWAPPGLLLVFARPQAVQAELCRGLPLAESGLGWSVSPALCMDAGQVGWIWEGQKHRFSLLHLRRADLTRLWDGEQIQYQEGACGGVKGLEAASLPQRARQHDDLRAPTVGPAQRGGTSNRLLGFFDLLNSFLEHPDNQAYVNRMIGLFEQEEWAEALRFALPLRPPGSTPATVGWMEPLRPREDLMFSLPALASAGFGLTQEALDLLQGLYRSAFQRLLEMGRVEEAAFVQGELLAEVEAAVDLLVDHGHLERAARLASLKGLPASRQIALWFEAGRLPIALGLARIHSAQGEALAHLERRQPSLVPRFQMAWARDLAGAGRLCEALQVAQPVRSQMVEYRVWLQQALNNEEPEALLLGLSDPELCERLQLVERVRDWLQAPGMLHQPQRRAFLEELSRLGPLAGPLREFAQSTIRSVLHQAGGPFPLASPAATRRLLLQSEDPWLQADRPRLPSLRGPSLGIWREVVERVGSTPVLDVAPLSGGRLLLALGHVGTVVLSRSGKIAQRSGAPAHALVSPRHGSQYLLVSQGRLHWYCSRRNQVRDFCRAHLTEFLPTHGGFHWLVADREQLLLMDLTGHGWQVLLHRVLPGRVLQMCLHEVRLGVLLDRGSQAGFAFFRYPELELLEEERQAVTGDILACSSLAPQRLRFGPEGLNLGGYSFPLVRTGLKVVMQEDVLVASQWSVGGMEVVAYPCSPPHHPFHLTLVGAHAVGVRVSGRRLFLGDDRGRVLVADLSARQWVRQHWI